MTALTGETQVYEEGHWRTVRHIFMRTDGSMFRVKTNGA